MTKLAIIALAASLFAAPAAAQDTATFTTGPVFADFGPHASVEQTNPLPADQPCAIPSMSPTLRRKAASIAVSKVPRASSTCTPPTAWTLHQIDVAVVVHGRAVLDF